MLIEAAACHWLTSFGSRVSSLAATPMPALHAQECLAPSHNTAPCVQGKRGALAPKTASPTATAALATAAATLQAVTRMSSRAAVWNKLYLPPQPNSSRALIGMHAHQHACEEQCSCSATLALIAGKPTSRGRRRCREALR